jgi:peptide chain release factor 3
LGLGSRFKGIYRLYDDTTHLWEGRPGEGQGEVISGLENSELDHLLLDQADELREAVDLVRGASEPFSTAGYLTGRQTPVFFGSALSGAG